MYDMTTIIAFWITINSCMYWTIFLTSIWKLTKSVLESIVSHPTTKALLFLPLPCEHSSVFMRTQRAFHIFFGNNYFVLCVAESLFCRPLYSLLFYEPLYALKKFVFSFFLASSSLSARNESYRRLTRKFRLEEQN